MYFEIFVYGSKQGLFQEFGGPGLFWSFEALLQISATEKKVFKFRGSFYAIPRAIRPLKVLVASLKAGLLITVFEMLSIFKLHNVKRHTIFQVRVFTLWLKFLLPS